MKILTLNQRIKDTERQLLSRQRQIDTVTHRLIRHLHRKMTAPSSLLLASATGFMLGEFTHSQAQNCDDAEVSNTTLFNLGKLIAAINTVSSILPLALMIKTFYQQSR
jgi:hypothetical protein